jgi:hypothetical protein
MSTIVECDIKCGPGWQSLINSTVQKITEIDSKVRITQIKEKFGTLVVKATIGDAGKFSQVQDIIKEAELKSSETCEGCGSKATVEKMNNVYMCICAKCRAKGKK